MRHMSFMLTRQAVLDETKTVTRRNGWDNAKSGEILEADFKCQGLKKGEHPEKLKIIKVISVRKEPLNRMTQDPGYGRREVILEGFPEMTPKDFVKMYCLHNKCTPRKRVNRIEFSYE